MRSNLNTPHYGELPEDPRSITLGQLLDFIRVNPHLKLGDVLNQLILAARKRNKTAELDDFTIIDLTL